ncbi:acyltransferase [Brunnivagina elsteri CCALA 953]|uniref:Acyltransferase n=2 Tax=Brunnivagina TaxID=3344733 RepID=A0A2A2TIL9_9CYAN|nr:acyltransferase [Calothrix elsteri]PAX54094.1 acyltransferase [Calothrix elsteri CCALA 953]
MVVTIHCAPPRSSIIYLGYDFSWLIFSNGLVAVWIFFCLSGYLMGKAFYSGRYTVDTKGIFNFWCNRALRIVPLYYFVLLILSIFVYTDILKMANWGYLFRLLTFTYQPYFYPQPIAFNDSLWSLSTEVQFYLLVPFIYSIIAPLIISLRHFITAFFIVIITVFLIKFITLSGFQKQIIEQFAYAFRYWYAPLINNLDLFICGFLINPLIQSYRQNKNTDCATKCIDINNKSNLNKKYLSRFNLFSYANNKIIAIALIVLLYLFTAHHFYNQELWGLPTRTGGFRTSTTIFILQPLTAIITCLFIFAFELTKYESYSKHEKLSFTNILKNPIRALEIMGNLSYGVYVWHVPIIQKITPIFISDIPLEAFAFRITATLILSSILATITYYLVEIPAAKFKIYREVRNQESEVRSEK